MDLGLEAESLASISNSNTSFGILRKLAYFCLSFTKNEGLLSFKVIEIPVGFVKNSNSVPFSLEIPTL